MGLETVFQQLYAMGCRPGEATDAELVSIAGSFNYMPERATTEKSYAAALREPHSRFYARQERKQ